MDLDACLGHPLWEAFAAHLIASGRWRRHWRWAEADWWRHDWATFLAGARALREQEARAAVCGGQG
jgi:hypothetical protein